LKKALVLLNMGGPNNLNEVELFLKNMFNDENIITVKSQLLRKFIAFMIVKGRKKAAIENYKEIGGKSPLVKNTKNLIKKLQEKSEDIHITFAMRYTPPFSKEVVEDLKKRDIKEVFLLPMYPHYSTTTTKSSLEEFVKTAKELKYDAKISSVKRFYKEEGYNKAVIEKIKDRLGSDDSKEFDLIFSAHSLPQKIIDSGDSYKDEIEDNVKILEDMLKKNALTFRKIHIAYQSKLGPVKWLEPSLEDKLRELRDKKIIIYPISFILDNSETLQELHIEYAAKAKELGVKDYRVCSCLNDSIIFIDFIHRYYIDTQY